MSFLENSVFIEIHKKNITFLTHICDLIKNILFILHLVYQDMQIIKSLTHHLSCAANSYFIKGISRK